MSLDATPGQTALDLRISRMEWAATDVLEVELRAPDGAALPAWAPGAHIDLALPNGLIRSYSLKGDPAQADRYVVGVGLDATSRGGSAYVHRTLRVGDILKVSAPLNNFPLEEGAAHSLLIAGGIGITPMVCMARRLAELGRACALHYAVRTADRAAFLDELQGMDIALHLHVDAEAGGPLDLAGIVAAAPPEAHLYCCGPAGMMQTFEAATEARPEDRVHVEYFTPRVTATDKGAETPFTVTLQRSGKTVEVRPGTSIVEALRAVGVAVDTSCEDGICGTCETRILAGTADHRDSVLTKKEQEAGRSMMICVSRCKGDTLVLDL